MEPVNVGINGAPPPFSHVFVDESKRGGGVVFCAVWVAPGSLARARSAVRKCLAPGQRRFHFTSEGRARRLAFLREIRRLGLQAVVIDASQCADETAAREACFRALVPSLLESRTSRLVVEVDETHVHQDQRVIRSAVAGSKVRDYFAWEFLRAHEEILLGLPDAIAWCWTKGGEWRGRVDGAVTRVIRL